MSFHCGAILVQLAAPPTRPRTYDETLHDPAWDPATEPPNPAEPVLAALYGGAVQSTDATAHVEQATSRSAEVPAVLFHRRCIVVVDFQLPQGCELEHAGASSRLDERLATLSARPDVERVMVLYLDGFSDTYALVLFARGARVRRFVHLFDAAGTDLSIDEGAPIATERDGHPEARIDGAARALLEDRGLLALVSDFDGPVFLCARDVQ